MLQPCYKAIKTINSRDSPITEPLWQPGGWADARGAPALGGMQHEGRCFYVAGMPRNLGAFLRVVRLFYRNSCPRVPHVQASNPENNILGDIRCVIRDALEITRGQQELQL